MNAKALVVAALVAALAVGAIVLQQRRAGPGPAIQGPAQQQGDPWRDITIPSKP